MDTTGMVPRDPRNRSLGYSFADLYSYHHHMSAKTRWRSFEQPGLSEQMAPLVHFLNVLFPFSYISPQSLRRIHDFHELRNLMDQLSGILGNPMDDQNSISVAWQLRNSAYKEILMEGQDQYWHVKDRLGNLYYDNKAPRKMSPGEMSWAGRNLLFENRLLHSHINRQFRRRQIQYSYPDHSKGDSAMGLTTGIPILSMLYKSKCFRFCYLPMLCFHMIFSYQGWPFLL